MTITAERIRKSKKYGMILTLLQNGYKAKEIADIFDETESKVRKIGETNKVNVG